MDDQFFLDFKVSLAGPPEDKGAPSSPSVFDVFGSTTTAVTHPQKSI
jgi:hypothetical protein